MKVPASARRPEEDAGALSPDLRGGAALATAPQPFDPAATAHDVALGELRRLLAVWAQHEPGARAGRDPEELHQLRVTARRIDATLGLFKHQLPQPLVRARKSAKAVLRTLGSARDVDVLLAGLDDYCATQGDEERSAAQPLRSLLTSERERLRSRMVRGLDSQATRHWLSTLAAASSEPGGTPDPALAVMPDRVQQRFRRLKKSVRHLGAKATPEDYHEVRRRAKQLRYATECGLPLFGKPAEELLKALRRLQERLGEQQDAHMARNRLTALAAETDGTLPPPTLFFMGRLAEHHARATAQARRTLDRAWRKVRGKRWKALRARLTQLRAEAPTATSNAVLSASLVPVTPAAAVPGPAEASGPELYPIKH
ncbi:MAG TPA: CHAD domain-containing protein [Steroidobacteraceae bacterium]|nr:CHAD domain-containing protein [Steroidobacteraceae bacterium]